MNRIVLPSDNLIKLNLYWNECIDIDLCLFYQSKKGDTDAVCSMEFTGKMEYEGNLDVFPFIKHLGDWLDCAEAIHISSLNDMALISICAFNYADCIEGELTDFTQYEGKLEVLVNDECIHSISMDNAHENNVYLFCRILCENGSFWLEDVNRVISLSEAYDSIPGFSKICN